jgi:hypothetical protein
VIVLVWRGLIELRGMDRGGAVVIVADPSGGRHNPAVVAAVLRERLASASQRERVALPEDEGDAGEFPEDLEVTHVLSGIEEEPLHATSAVPASSPRRGLARDEDRDEDVELTVSIAGVAPASGSALPIADPEEIEDTRDEDVELTVSIMDIAPASGLPFATATATVPATETATATAPAQEEGLDLDLETYAAIKAALWGKSEEAEDAAPVLAARGLTPSGWRRIDADMRRRALAEPRVREALRAALSAARAARAGKGTP